MLLVLVGIIGECCTSCNTWKNLFEAHTMAVFFQSRFSVAMIRQTVLKQATEKTWRNDLKWTNKIQVYDVFRSQCGDVKNSFVVTYSLLHF